MDCFFAEDIRRINGTAPLQPGGQPAQRDSGYPALVIELKWNDPAEGAIRQILDRNYPEALKEYGGEIILAGINYNKNAPVGERKHTCRIFRIEETD